MRWWRAFLVPMMALSLGTGCDGGTDAEPEPDPDPDPSPNLVGPEGGTLVFDDLTLVIPAGALDREVEITADAIAGTGAVPSGFLAVDGSLYDMGPDGLTFDEPVTITIDYDVAALPAGVAEWELGLLHLDGAGEVLESTLDTSTRTVSATVGGFSSFGVGLEVGDVDRVACGALQPAALSGIPTERVALGQLPGVFGETVVARTKTGPDDDEPLSWGLVVVGNGGNAELIVPVHPSTSPEGGEVFLEITDGRSACRGFDFTIDPLTPAPGELAAITDQMQAVLDAQAAIMETSSDELLSTPVSELPTTLVPLAVVQSVIDHPDNGRSLRALAEGTSGASGDARLDLLEPLLARTGLRDALAGTAARLRARAGSGAAGDGRRGPARTSAFLCDPHNISTAPVLDDCMQAAASAEFELAGASGEVLNDIGTVFGAVGLVPLFAIPASVMGTVSWAALNQKQRTAALYPSAFADIIEQIAPTTFAEDQDGPGTWSASVVATSRPWDLGKEGLETMLQALGFLGNFDDVQVAGPEVSGIVSWFMTGPVVNELIGDGTLESFQIPARTTQPIDVSDEAWSERSLIGSAFTLGADHNQYEPKEPGSATLVVRTKGGSFGGAQATVQQELTVNAITLTISPDEVTLAGGETQEFTVTVENSVHPEMVEIDQDVEIQGSLSELSWNGEQHTVTYTAPAEPDVTDPDLVVVRHTAETGARAESSTPRVAIGTVNFPAIEITPRDECLDAGETLQFTAEVIGDEDAEVRWSADVGSIDENTGLYTAPSEVAAGATAVITATSVDNPSIDDSVVIDLGSCQCRFSVLIDGQSVVSNDGDIGTVSYFTAAGESLVSVVLGDVHADEALGVAVNPAAPGVAVGTTGPYPVTFNGNLRLASDEVGIGSESFESATVFLTENDGVTVEGSFSGEAVKFRENGQTRSILVTGQFRFVDPSPGSGGVGSGRIYTCTVGDDGP